jgi:hypothetical protein
MARHGLGFLVTDETIVVLSPSDSGDRPDQWQQYQRVRAISPRRSHSAAALRFDKVGKPFEVCPQGLEAAVQEFKGSNHSGHNRSVIFHKTGGITTYLLVCVQEDKLGQVLISAVEVASAGAVAKAATTKEPDPNAGPDAFVNSAKDRGEMTSFARGTSCSDVSTASRNAQLTQYERQSKQFARRNSRGGVSVGCAGAGGPGQPSVCTLS